MILLLGQVGLHAQCPRHEGLILPKWPPPLFLLFANSVHRVLTTLQREQRWQMAPNPDRSMMVAGPKHANN